MASLTDKRIRNKIEELQLSYNKVFKNRNRETPAAKAEREVFVKAIEQTFDIKDAVSTISFTISRTSSLLRVLAFCKPGRTQYRNDLGQFCLDFFTSVEWSGVEFTEEDNSLAN